MWTEILTVAVGLVTVALIYDWHRHQYWQRLGVKPIPEYIPFFGQFFKDISPRRWDFIDKHYQNLKGEKIVGTYGLMYSHSAMFCDPEFIQNILVKDFDHFMDLRNIDMKGSDAEVLNDMLTNATGSHWKALRSVMSPTFSSGKLKNMFYLVQEKSKGLLSFCRKEMETKSVVNMKNAFSKYTMDVIGTCAFGIEINMLGGENEKFAEAAESMFKFNFSMILKFIFCMRFPKLSRKLGISLSNPSQKYLVNIAKNTMETRKENSERGDFMDLLLASQREGKKDPTTGEEIMTDNAIISAIILFILGGFDTTATSLIFVARCLADNPSCQQTLRNELRKRQNDNSDGQLTYQDIMESKYLDGVAAESLRMYPPAHFTERSCTKDYNVPGTSVIIKVGDIVSVPIFSLHYDEDYFPDPKTFKPERFFPENKDSIPSGVYIPFGIGPRMCIAQRFALMELKLAIADLVLNFELSIAKGSEILEFDTTPGIMRPTAESTNLVLKELTSNEKEASS